MLHPLYFPVPMKPTGISRRKFLGAAAAAAASIQILPAELRAKAKLSAPGKASSVLRISSSAAPIPFDPDKALGSSMDILSHYVV
ncbi:MAG TPA: twin-arginine translocation signal domain-containing protein, partial [Candidatus Sulfotelmatobacter sp.]|nr:twin-arginine translocation signal domain-containing protein [Candidatus Sulfotelmatobacter sp.]